MSLKQITQLLYLAFLTLPGSKEHQCPGTSLVSDTFRFRKRLMLLRPAITSGWLAADGLGQ